MHILYVDCKHYSSQNTMPHLTSVTLYTAITSSGRPSKKFNKTFFRNAKALLHYPYTLINSVIYKHQNLLYIKEMHLNNIIIQ